MEIGKIPTRSIPQLSHTRRREMGEKEKEMEILMGAFIVCYLLYEN